VVDSGVCLWYVLDSLSLVCVLIDCSVLYVSNVLLIWFIQLSNILQQLLLVTNV
jgi:hypothetical protein